MSEFHDYGPVPWWCLCGVVEKKELLRQFQILQDAEIDEFFIYQGYGLYEPDFLSNEWFDVVGFIIEEENLYILLKSIWDFIWERTRP